VLKLAITRVYQRRFEQYMGPAEFMACVYATLGVRQGNPRGLFQTFDPTKYNGSLPLEKHFLNVFMKRLRARLHRSRHPRTDNGRNDPDQKFVARPELGLFRQQGRHGTYRSLEDLPDRAWPPRGLQRLLETLPEALSTLTPWEREVIEWAYSSSRLSTRKIGSYLGIDHKTVKRRHDKALEKLRDFYQEEILAEKVRLSAPKRASGG
jgi:RNA polymerase sigma factor (sigma-70 family)